MRRSASRPLRLASLAVPFAVILMAAATPARAVDNSIHTLGVGAVTQFTGTGGPTQISLKRALQPRFEAAVLFGFGADGNSADFFPGLKMSYILIPEERMNLYFSMGMSVDLRTNVGVNAFLYQVGPGVEFFTPYWPNLGFSFEFGFGGAVGDRVGGRGFTTNLTPVGAAGIHYYF